MPNNQPSFTAWKPGTVASMQPWAPAAPSPLVSVPVTGNIEKDDKAEGAAVLSALEQVRASIALGMDAAYVVPIVFLSRQQADVFLSAYPEVIRESDHEPCIDGLAFARRLRVKLPDCRIALRAPKVDHRLLETVGVIPLKGGGRHERSKHRGRKGRKSK